MEKREILEILADVSEDLALELYSGFEEEDYPHLDKSLVRLIRASDALTQGGVQVPFTVSEVIRIFKKAHH